jgi:hypothetical protein
LLEYIIYGQTLAVVRPRSTSATVIILWTSLIFGVVNTGSELEIDRNQRCEIGFLFDTRTSSILWSQHLDDVKATLKTNWRISDNEQDSLQVDEIGRSVIVLQSLKGLFIFSNQFFRYHQNITCLILMNAALKLCRQSFNYAARIAVSSKFSDS